MQLVLVAGFNTKLSSFGPKVKLFAGNWRIVMENWIGSNLVLYDGVDEVPLVQDCFYVTKEDRTVNLKVKIPGDEKSLTVFLEYTRDPKSAKSA